MSSSKTSEEREGGVYVLRDPETGDIVYVGHTNDAGRRADEHSRARRSPSGESYIFDLIYPTNDRSEQRGLEEHLYNLNVNSGNLQNRIRPISERNPNASKYRQAGQDYLERDNSIDNSG